jgi:prepilin-type N-terminal cleavage/methylation domain-containing protein
MSKQKGFTLIELLVVVAIIGLLSTIAVVSFNNAQAKARDAKRMADLKSMQKAVELFIQNDATNSQAPIVTGTATWNTTGTTLKSMLNQYLSNSIPTDPLNDASHFYVYCSNDTRYFLYVVLEKSLPAGYLVGTVNSAIYPSPGQCVASNGGTAASTATPTTCDSTHFCLGGPF